MSVNETTRLADLIAQKLTRIKDISRKKVVIKNKLDEVNLESRTLTEELNRLDDEVKSLKYEISECLSENNLKLVVGE